MRKSTKILLALALLLSSVFIFLFVNYSDRKMELSSEIEDLNKQVLVVKELIKSNKQYLDSRNGEKNTIVNEIHNLELAVEKPKMISHKGYNEVAPENTMPAFQAGVENGFTNFETDIYFTKDNIPVLSHNDLINYMARNKDGSSIKKNKKISEMTLDELRQYDFGIYKGQQFAGTKIPTLEELLSYSSQEKRVAFLHLDLKASFTYAQKEIMVNLVKKYGMESKVSWLSFRWTDFDDFDSLAPSMQVELLAPHFSYNLLYAAQRFDNGLRNVVMSISYTDENLFRALNYGYDVYVWSVNDEEIMAEYKGTGISGIETDGSKTIENVIKSEEFAKLKTLREQLITLQVDLNENNVILVENQKYLAYLTEVLSKYETDLKHLTIFNWMFLEKA